MNKILVTGASGFVGNCLLAHLAQGPHVAHVAHVARAAVRRPMSAPPLGGQYLLADMSATTDWREAVAGQDVVIHCAARVHLLRDAAADPLEAFRAVNTAGTLQLARQAAATGVRRFVFMSSVGVNGAQTHGQPFRETDAAAPHSDYARSKYEAEQGLLALAAATGMEVGIVRAPLVYGLGAPGNFEVMLRWLRRGVPLPLASIDNLRSYVAVDNLADFLLTCAFHPNAANEVFLVSDGHDLSTPELLRRLGLLLDRPARLVPVPPALLGLGARLAGRPELVQRLCGSLQMDIGKARQLLGWRPALSVDEGLHRAVSPLETPEGGRSRPAVP